MEIILAIIEEAAMIPALVKVKEQPEVYQKKTMSLKSPFEIVFIHRM